jgi:putative acetyltransferase
LPQNPLMRVSIESPNQPEIIALIADLDAYQDTLYPAEARYVLDLTALTQRNVLFAVARDANGAAIGCGAIVLYAKYGEVKRMYFQPEARGQGTAQHIIDALESTAYTQGCKTFMLETGRYQVEALAFYANQGYEQCAPFGDYPEHPPSVFMCKQFIAESANP